jgi:RNA polymerase sigma-70 factor (ECF subfamily)
MRRSKADDAVLIERAQKGDRAAFDTLIANYEDRAYQYAYRLTNNKEDAMDIVAETFVRVHGALKNFRGQSAFGTWLYRILTNCSLDMRKKEKRNQHSSLDTPVVVDGSTMERQIEDEGPGPGEEAETSAREAAIQMALGNMPEYQKAMLVMYHVEMQSYEDIAQILDLPLGTVKSRLNRARIALREQLSQDAELFQIG